ncbi:MAG: glucose-1-phosphate cytidylyltransferase [Luteolibacter sp.]
MKVVILAGGFGTRISEESAIKPKPMIEVGHMPILWHIMSIYSHYGLNDFVICLGYKGHLIKEFFANYFLNRSDVRFDLRTNKVEFLNNAAEPWTVTLVDTGEGSLTGGRLKRVAKYLDDETFCMTYGDGVSDVNIPESIEFHKKNKALCTLTAVQPPGRFGAFSLGENDAKLSSFHEKPVGDGAWINGGFFVLEPEVLDYIDGDLTTWEKEPMQNLASEGKLCAFKHAGFWQSMDTLRDKMVLEEHWASGKAPWKLWSK